MRLRQVGGDRGQLSTLARPRSTVEESSNTARLNSPTQLQVHRFTASSPSRRLHSWGVFTASQLRLHCPAQLTTGSQWCGGLILVRYIVGMHGKWGGLMLVG